ncbi:T6SS immunity protein Tdi1 domain-containing protein, partial [Pseudomonas viridiflava]|uniref:T6SS immunity protein Tdi1 domain-containing protein n=1 Tax=Pseudomonas viridiflava TaxID=33069 RepID=UPI001F14DDFA
MQPERNDVDYLFELALKKLGPLDPDEMYAFVPALALGGSMELKNLKKVKPLST